MQYFIAGICVFVAMFSLSSCRIEGSFRGLYSYYNVTKKEHPSFVQRPSGDICELKFFDDPIVLRINGNELKSCLRDLDYSIVYFWPPNCGATVCIPPKYAQEFCSDKGIDLFVVGTYYAFNQMSEVRDMIRPLFAMDTDYYRTNLTKRYSERFLSDLVGEVNFESPIPRFLLFHSDSLIGTASIIEEIGI